MEQTELIESKETKELVLALSGAAFILFGAGLLLSHPMIRRLLGQVSASGLAGAALPDIERYLRLKNM